MFERDGSGAPKEPVNVIAVAVSAALEVPELQEISSVSLEQKLENECEEECRTLMPASAEFLEDAGPKFSVSLSATVSSSNSLASAILPPLW